MQLIGLFMALSEYPYWYWVFRVVRCFSTWLHFWQAIFQCQNAKGEHIFFFKCSSLFQILLCTHIRVLNLKKSTRSMRKPGLYICTTRHVIKSQDRLINVFSFFFLRKSHDLYCFSNVAFLFRDKERKLLGWLDFYRSRCKFCMKMQDFELWMSKPIFDV